MPGRRSLGCIGSKKAFLCGVVCFSTCLTGWVVSFRLSFCFVTVFVVVIVVNITVRVRGIGGTVFVSGIMLNIFSLFSLFFQQVTLISEMSWFFYSGGTLVCVCRHWCLWVVGSHCLSVARQGLPNHSALIPFPDV